jgi:hypothetical protein
MTAIPEAIGVWLILELRKRRRTGETFPVRERLSIDAALPARRHTQGLRANTT